MLANGTIQALLVAFTLLIGALTAYLMAKTSQLNATAKVHDAQLNGPTHVSDARIAALERTGAMQGPPPPPQFDKLPPGHWEYIHDTIAPTPEGAISDNAAVRPDRL